MKQTKQSIALAGQDMDVRCSRWHEDKALLLGAPCE